MTPRARCLVRAGLLSGTAVLAVALVAAPARYGFGMSKLKSWVNTVKPGTFPDMESASKTEEKPAPKQ
ncbi:MAG: hypothetical protein ACHQZQ_08930, partial [SAR324 cluster bacterium]